MMEKRLPYYEVSGGYREVGEFIGSTFRKEIQEEIEKRRLEIKNYLSYLPRSQKFWEITNKYLPDLMLETEGIARGADVPMIEYFFINNREVYDGSEGDHCTTVAGFDGEKLAIGHNEDWSAESQDEIYILKATIGETTFIGLNYINVVPGVAATMNNYGLVQCINELTQSVNLGVPKNYVARAVLEAKTLVEAEKIIRNIPGASGFNHVLGQGSEVWDVESAGNNLVVEKLNGQPFVHTNHFISDELKSLDKEISLSSVRRFARATQLIREKMTTEDIRTILTDSDDKEYPICRTKKTIASAIFKPGDLEAYFCYGHPCAGEFIKYKLS